MPKPKDPTLISPGDCCDRWVDLAACEVAFDLFQETIARRVAARFCTPDAVDRSRPPGRAGRS